jgi:hypothetical protein
MEPESAANAGAADSANANAKADIRNMFMVVSWVVVLLHLEN